MTPVLRPGTRADWVAMAELVATCFAEYRAFAHAGWEPPGADRELAHISLRLDAPDAYVLVATGAGRHLGHVAMHPAPDEPGVLHLMHLFLTVEQRGTGLGHRLLEAAVAEGRRQGARQLRLNTPEGQVRARAFYVRAGWRVARSYDVPAFGLPLVEYRLEL